MARAGDFLEWLSTRSGGLGDLESLAQGVEQTIRSWSTRDAVSPRVAAKLPEALEACDRLTFDLDEEVLAYAALHLTDRYTRVLQVLEHVMSIGRLPLRTKGISALEIGAGPAPALYATHDFYAALNRWPGRGETQVGSLEAFHALDRGQAWDKFLHRLSEKLLDLRQSGARPGQFEFQRTFDDLSGFNASRTHNDSIAASAEQIQHEFDQADEPISRPTAFRWAYEDGTTMPSAYDLIFVPYFLTQTQMIEAFRIELKQLAASLTPGGIFIVLSAVESHADIRDAIERIARSKGLNSISPSEPLDPNRDRMRQDIVARQLRRSVQVVKAASPVEFAQIVASLPKDLVDENVNFTRPRFVAQIFVNQHAARRGRNRRTRR